MAQIIEKYTDEDINIFTGGLNRVLDDSLEGSKSVYDKLFKIDPVKTKFIRESYFGGYGLMQEAHENIESLEGDAQEELGQATAEVNLYAKSITLGYEAMEDDQEGVLKDAKQKSRKIQKASVATRETHSANILNNGFNASNTGGYDNDELLADDHTTTSGSYQSNILAVAADLDIDSLEDMLQLVDGMHDDRGIPVDMVPKYLVVPYQARAIAMRSLNSTLRPGTALNDDNWVRDAYSLSPVIWKYLTDSDAWFIICEDVSGDGLVFSERKALRAKVVDQPDHLRLKGIFWERYIPRWVDWRYVYGTPGA